MGARRRSSAPADVVEVHYEPDGAIPSGQQLEHGPNHNATPAAASLGTLMFMRDKAYMARLQAAERRLYEHPGYGEYINRRALYQTIAHVFRPNFAELIRALDAPSHDESLATELVQNVRRPDVCEAYQGVLVRLLHNHVCSSRTVVDHVRRIMRGRSGYIRMEFDARRAKLVEHGEVHFVNGLRNFMLHRTLPLVGHSLSITDANKPTQTFNAAVTLSVRQLLEDDSWSAPARAFLASQGSSIDLRAAVRLHGDLVYRLNTWLYDELERESEPVLAELNSLVNEVNAALLDCDVETARTHPIHEMRQHP